jgi:YfiH family protein
MNKNNSVLKYNLGEGVEAFSTHRDYELTFPVVMGKQIHGSGIAVIENPDDIHASLEGFDAFITNKVGCAIAVRTADCVPILLYDPIKRVVAAVHSGWKGTVQRIPKKCIIQMEIRYGSKPADILAIIGPGIAKESFQVGVDVINHFKNVDFDINDIYSWEGPKSDIPMQGGHHLDLFKANQNILIEAGVLPENIQICGIDTFKDTSFFSARREGVECGRIFNVIKMF